MSEVPDPDIMVVAAAWTFAALAAISLGLRIWCRMFRVGMLWWDDLVLGISVFTIILTAACITAMFRAGWSADPVPHGRPVVLFLAASSCAAVAAGLSKTAYMVTLLRLTTEPWTRRVLSFFVASLNVVLWFSALACWARLCEEGPSRVLGNAYTGVPIFRVNVGRRDTWLERLLPPLVNLFSLCLRLIYPMCAFVSADVEVRSLGLNRSIHTTWDLRKRTDDGNHD
ncbi:hypothetical protein PG997_014052 [Apiospora hydei]|uniref:Integral membrane protein n=1 Tax=Apiospora hydei TaxID=1337664 RepID=A0ABR1V7Y1_9PEZI